VAQFEKTFKKGACPMKKQWFFILLFSFLFALSLLGVSVRPVSARYTPPKAPPPLKPTSIQIADPGSQKLGQSFMVTGSIKTPPGYLPDSRPVIITVDGKLLGETRTDKNGNYALKITLNLTAGTYTLAATYKGTHLLAASTANTQLQILPTEVRIQTVPALAGVAFTMDGRQFLSGPDGVASISIPKAGLYRLTVNAEQYSNPDQRISFSRWLDEDYRPFHDIMVPTNKAIVVGLNIFYKVNQYFVDLSGNPVDPKRITGITIKSAQGDIFNYQQNQTQWVPASRIARRSTGLEQTKLLYSVMAVNVDGSNVVTAAQQRFFTGPTDTWKIALTLYAMQLNGRDLLFGSPAGQAVTLKFPNGRTESYPLNQAGAANISYLARGIYQVQLTGTKGLDNTNPVALSKNQAVTENVITYLDLEVTGGIGLFIALGLLLFGRPWLLVTKKYRVKFKGYRVQQSEWASIHDN
jgi:hypothetical protein